MQIVSNDENDEIYCSVEYTICHVEVERRAVFDSGGDALLCRDGREQSSTLAAQRTLRETIQELLQTLCTRRC